MTYFPAAKKTRSGALRRREDMSVTERRGDSVREKDQVLPLVVRWLWSTTRVSRSKMSSAATPVRYLGSGRMVKGIMYLKTGMVRKFGIKPGGNICFGTYRFNHN